MTDADFQRRRGETLLKKTWCDITSLPQPHWINNSSITYALPRQHLINTMATLNRSVSGKGCWGRRNWKRQGNRSEVDEAVIVIRHRRDRERAEGMDDGLAMDR